MMRRQIDALAIDRRTCSRFRHGSIAIEPLVREHELTLSMEFPGKRGYRGRVGSATNSITYWMLPIDQQTVGQFSASIRAWIRRDTNTPKGLPPRGRARDSNPCYSLERDARLPQRARYAWCPRGLDAHLVEAARRLRQNSVNVARWTEPECFQNLARI